MFRALLLLAGFVLVTAQVPSFGACPKIEPMAGFNLKRYMGTWYEQERYFTFLEAGSRCVTANYSLAEDGRATVANEITNRVTGIKRVLLGELKMSGKAGEGKLSVTYSNALFPIDTEYSVIDTDYDSYSVVWSCFNFGLANTKNVWVMTRERVAPSEVLQRAYGVLDKNKISHSSVVKTNQDECGLPLAQGTTPAPSAAPDAPAPERAVVSGNDAQLRGAFPIEGPALLVPEVVLAAAESVKLKDDATTAKPPGGIQLPEGLPSLPSGLPSLPSRPEGLPSLPESFPTGLPTVPTGLPTVPTGLPTVPTGLPTVPTAFPTLPTGFPSLPTGLPSQPVTESSKPETEVQTPTPSAPLPESDVPSISAVGLIPSLLEQPAEKLPVEQQQPQKKQRGKL